MSEENLYRAEVGEWHESATSQRIFDRMLEHEVHYVDNGQLAADPADRAVEGGGQYIWGEIEFEVIEEDGDLHPIHVYNAFCKLAEDYEAEEEGDIKFGVSHPHPTWPRSGGKPKCGFSYRYGWGKAGEGLVICYYPTRSVPSDTKTDV